MLADLLPGSHRVKVRNAAGVTLYWYAWRGGPRILTVTALGDADLARKLAETAPAAIVRHQAARTAGDKLTLYGLITRYLANLEDLPGAARTKADTRKHLDKIRAELGDLELRALESPITRKGLIDWRNTRKKTPKTADELMAALRKVIAWAVDQGEVGRNPIEDVAGLYVPPDRSAIIWEPHHIEALLKHAEKPFADAVQVAAHTGIRLGDLRRLTWAMVGKDAIVFQSGKSNRRRTVVIPITDALRDILAGIPRSDRSVTVLNSRKRLPWSEPGLESAIQRCRADALAEAKAKHGASALSGLEGLRIHDLRGTAATNFMRWGLEDRDIAVVLGWKEAQVSEIRRRYVSGQEIGLAMMRRIKENRARAENAQ